uniref:PXMP2/4 family protein 4-like n=1 Tax=Rhizophora mucronata TaxID=61149 RepID=A0A2P2LGZ7_RHIMU
MVKSRPILTKSITTSVIYVAADLSSQTITLPASESYDLMRTLRMAGYGIIILGPSLHFWFNFVSKVLPKKDLISTFKKILMGQTLYGPVMNVVFFSLNAFLQGKDKSLFVAFSIYWVLFILLPIKIHWLFMLLIFFFMTNQEHFSSNIVNDTDHMPIYDLQKTA